MKYNTMRSSNALLVHWMQEIHIRQVIQIGSRIIAICDSIDAMSSNRCYRKAHNMDFCYQEIEKNLGKMYDSEIGKVVLEHWNYIVGNEKEKYKKENYI
jgi:HD-GYP domain-containing protein (c-di-GMP phosphodiesterase class II)